LSVGLNNQTDIKNTYFKAIALILQPIYLTLLVPRYSCLTFSTIVYNLDILPKTLSHSAATKELVFSAFLVHLSSARFFHVDKLAFLTACAGNSNFFQSKTSPKELLLSFILCFILPHWLQQSSGVGKFTLLSWRPENSLKWQLKYCSHINLTWSQTNSTHALVLEVCKFWWRVGTTPNVLRC